MALEFVYAQPVKIFFGEGQFARLGEILGELGSGRCVIASARKTGAVLTVENHNVIGGLHSAVCETLALERIPVTAFGVADRFGEVGKIPYLRQAMGLTKEDLLAAARRAAATK